MSFCARSLGLLTMLATSVLGQATPPSPPPDQLQRANQMFVAGDWSGVLAAYQALSKSYPTHALSRFRIGVAQL